MVTNLTAMVILFYRNGCFIPSDLYRDETKSYKYKYEVDRSMDLYRINAA